MGPIRQTKHRRHLPTTLPWRHPLHKAETPGNPRAIPLPTQNSNHMQAIEGPPELGGPKKMPACSLSPVETAMGGILRMCMHNLENKDRSCRQKGYKRYWVVTNVDRVAADIKSNLKKLKGQSVFTRDFARMYTSSFCFLLKSRARSLK